MFESFSRPSRRSAIEPPTSVIPCVRAQPDIAATDSPPSSGSAVACSYSAASPIAFHFSGQRRRCRRRSPRPARRAALPSRGSPPCRRRSSSARRPRGAGPASRAEDSSRSMEPVTTGRPAPPRSRGAPAAAASGSSSTGQTISQIGDAAFVVALRLAGLHADRQGELARDRAAASRALGLITTLLIGGVLARSLHRAVCSMIGSDVSRAFDRGGRSPSSTRPGTCSSDVADRASSRCTASAAASSSPRSAASCLLRRRGAGLSGSANALIGVSRQAALVIGARDRRA